LPGLPRRLLPLPRLTLELLWLPLLPLARRRCRLLPLCRLILCRLALCRLALELLTWKLLSLELLSRNLLRLPLLPLAGHGVRLLVRTLLTRILLTSSGLPRVRRWILPHLLFPRVLSHPLPLANPKPGWALIASRA
jgi:hypothetical protein